MKKETCLHTNKAYKSGGMSLTCNPPINITYWICKDCGFEGEDRSQLRLDTEYGETMSKFGKKGCITYSDDNK